MAFAHPPAWSFIFWGCSPPHIFSWKNTQRTKHTNNNAKTQNLLIQTNPSISTLCFFSLPPKNALIFWSNVGFSKTSSRLKVIVRPLTRFRNIFSATSWRFGPMVRGIDRWRRLVVVMTRWCGIYINGCEGVKQSEFSRHMEKICEDRVWRSKKSCCCCCCRLHLFFSIKELLAFRPNLCGTSS